MKRIILPLILSFSGNGFASSLQEQLSAVAQAEQQGKAEEQRLSDIQQEKINAAERLERQRRASAVAEANRKAAIASAEKKARREKIEAEVKADKTRDQGYEDELRSLEIQKQKLALAREEARVKRENEFIDQELKNQAAHTDVIQSNADSNRNMSEGGRDLMKSEGKAREKKASGWFN
ncbi:TPA: DUF5384 family protein [Enterobacter hormaechei]|uniref:DUF5384 family protein n=1 Tax=Enterobacter mori TaxID=539813 RepID=A0A9Q7JXZ8_9ENTR|nr:MULTISPECIES: DUF5384 family protein [Enterobacteriaceae]ELX3410790.1 DUF5384 family protein [Salmonella enterica]MCC8233243.1 DUF5384 family protein [Enterobacter mori]MCC8242594.1 DUF5384 family protein [Enterobacter mori]MDR9954095.1 DUF5384 family protein [Enterobacter hormaechei subsp. xiangfangensis]MDS0093364.1 DUF5384 family protein [Enterobacter hormaechei subsp. xiangfangensis]